ncbi:DUF397 domain-containing protein [Streptomyces griseocarneus]|nr:DUF397 domain-containing protein [Streptomyces griseocarneus]
MSSYWTKSSYSHGDGGDCVETAPATPALAVPVRDSKNPGGRALAIPHPAWSSFISNVKVG